MTYLELITHKGKGIVEDLKKALGGVRTGRPSPALLEDIRVSYYEQMVPLKQVGSIGVQPPRELFIQVWDKAAIPGIVKTIESSSLNVSANVDGNNVRIFLPELSQERRDELVKHVKKVAEEHRIEVRHVRDEVMKMVEELFESGELSEDRKFKAKEEVQKEVEKLNGMIEEAVSKKIQEIAE